MEIHTGTSGYSYSEWKGSFYPEKLPVKQMLHYYGERFSAVEINYTFNRLPKPSVLEAWAAEVPANFNFALKAPQRITHFQRLKDSGDTLSKFLEVSDVLKKRLGPLLFQLPPNFKKDLPRLQEFLTLLPSTTRATFEFRHASWFDDEVFDLLRKRKVALCNAEADDDLKLPFVATTNWGYLRLRRSDYSTPELKAWMKLVQSQDWRDVFVFFKHEDEGNAPKLAAKFLELAK